MFKFALRAKAVRENPAAAHSIPLEKRRVDVLTMAQVHALVDHVPEEYKAAVWFAVFTGARPAELAGVRVRSIDFARSRVELVETVMPVGGRMTEGPVKTAAGERVVPIPQWLCETISSALAKRAAQRGAPLEGGERVFLAPKGGPLNRTWFHQRVVRPAVIAAGLPPTFRTYDLRHTHTSLLIHLGAHPKAVSERMGHTEIGTTMNTYGHIFEGVQDDLTERLDRERETSAERPWAPAPVVELGSVTARRRDVS